MNKEHLQNIVEELIRDQDIFLVGLSVDSQNVIQVYIDSNEGVSIDQCVDMSRKIGQRLNRDTGDFSLEVSSPGLNTPLKILPQYKKNLGREVAVITYKGEKFKGVLRTADDSGITLEFNKREKQKGKNKTLKRVVTKELNFRDIKSTKVVIKI